MQTTDGQVTVVFNGEIYNFPSLTEELKRLGYQFRTHCDTEVILLRLAGMGSELR